MSHLNGFSLEKKEYFKIKTPFINRYKSVGGLPTGFLKMADFTSKLQKSKRNHFHWELPVISDQKYNSVEEFFKSNELHGDFLLRWYDQNREKIETLRNKIIELKSYNKDNDTLYFYNNALIYVMGTIQSLPEKTVTLFGDEIAVLFCYIFDFPYEQYFNLERTFDSDEKCYAEYSENLPLFINVWHDMIAKSGNKEAESFTKYSIMLFDVMVEIAIMASEYVDEPEFAENVSEQIRSYYKWLKKKKLYPPKEIQEKIYMNLK